MNTLNITQITALNQAVKNCEYTPYPKYSGRGMYGDTCYGFTVDRYTSSVSAILKIINDLLNDCGGDDEFEDVRDMIETLSNVSVKEDSLGLDSIIYFQGLRIPEDWEDEESEEEDDSEEE